MRKCLLVILMALFLSAQGGALGQSCGVSCNDHVNMAFANASDLYSRETALASFTKTVASSPSCGCQDLVNVAVLNSTDLYGQIYGPSTSSRTVKFTYVASLDLSKDAELVYNMTDLGSKLAIIEYTIEVTNTGEVNITGIEVNDTLLHIYSLGDLSPGESEAIIPKPRYTVTTSDVMHCWINNTANATGQDRCCEQVSGEGGESYLMNIEELETVLKRYSVLIREYGQDIRVSGGNASDLEIYEGIIKNQSYRLQTFEDLLHQAWPDLPD